MTRKKKSLKVITFNIRHGRGKRGLNPPVFRRETVERKLNKIAQIFSEEDADIVLLQEADRKSILSGNFNHVEYLARVADYEHLFFGEHVNTRGLSYGTAILSRHELLRGSSHTLETGMPILRKGYTLATVSVLFFNDIKIDIVSAHFAWARVLPQSRRKKHALSMVEQLQSRERKNPLIVGGDFNCDYRAGEKTLDYIAEKLELALPHEQGNHSHAYPSDRRCIDWIMVSPVFKIESCRYIPERVSDHYPVVAELSLRKHNSQSLEY